MSVSNPPRPHHHFTRLLVLAVGALVTAIITVSTVVEQQRASPPPPPCAPLSVVESVRHADLILTGDVFLVVPAEAGLATVLITPHQVYKGDVPALGVRIRALATTEGANVNTDDLHFASQQPSYLLFLQEDTDGLYRTSRCIGSRSLGSGLTATERALLEQ